MPRPDRRDELIPILAGTFAEMGFAGLSACDDPEIRSELNAMYQHMHGFISGLLKQQASVTDPALAAWALIGLGTVSNIAREVGLFPLATQRKLMSRVGGSLAGLD